jgi:hypothetical protein
VSEPMFEEFKKIPRLFRDCTITEKIDGTNGQIYIRDPMDGLLNEANPTCLAEVEGNTYNVYVGSRNRWIYPVKSLDNSGFAAWVVERAPLLVEILGVGRHYGEFWGAGIQRRYGLTGNDKRFSLFHPRWEQVLTGRSLGGLPIPDGLGVVPILYQGKFETKWVEDCIFRLRQFGSVAAPGFMDAEGVVVYHEAAKQYFKTTIKDDEKPKGSTE